MSCCQNPTKLGCYCSCDTVTIPLEDYEPNEVYVSFDFNGANRKVLVTDVSDTGQPLLDLKGMDFNEDYYYTFGVYDRATSELLGCYQIKVSPCAGDVFDIPAVDPVSNYIDSTIIFGSATCSGETTIPFDVFVTDHDKLALQDGSVINFSFSAIVPGVTIELYQIDTNYEIISPTQARVVSAAAITNITLGIKVSTCDANTITAVVTSFTNLVDTWGNGTHTSDTININ